MRLSAARRLAVAAASASVMAASLSVAAPVVASTAVGGLELSLDGTVWSESIPAALFDELPVLVPGDTVTRTLLVRNATGTDAVLRIDAVDVRIGSADFARSLRIGAAVDRVGDQARAATAMVALDGSESCTTVLPSGSLAADDVAAIVISLGFDENASMPSQRSSAGLSLLLSASQAVGQEEAFPACPVDGIQLPVLALPDGTASGDGTAATAPPTVLGLPITGAIVAPLIAASGALVLLGLGALTIVRRRERSE